MKANAEVGVGTSPTARGAHAVAAFIPTYNHHWRLEELRYQSPIEARLAFPATKPLSA